MPAKKGNSPDGAILPKQNLDHLKKPIEAQQLTLENVAKKEQMEQ